MTVFEIQRKNDTLHVKKNGEHYAKTACDKFPATASSVYGQLFERNGFAWWAVLRDYYADGAPEKWLHDVEVGR